MALQPNSRKTKKARTRPDAAGTTAAKKKALRNGNGAHLAPAAAGVFPPGAGGQPAPGANRSTIQTRRPQYMISTQAAPGVQPLSANLVEQQLKASPDIQFV